MDFVRSFHDSIRQHEIFAAALKIIHNERRGSGNDLRREENESEVAVENVVQSGLQQVLLVRRAVLVDGLLDGKFPKEGGFPKGDPQLLHVVKERRNGILTVGVVID